eukprot:CAMPEP_0119122550 /NCGR_PEP_ID=MMETSP1310-20130426/2781_1 /TAXON_ID=464262 /ORGANISM="Genus nov. species nov., Strain RCC2339" /LENGTH=414 /DNA_ID=CAMNT_0007112229 /DNA_START=52 /DNA_END=1296 /DNA_ORIENTATION=+
MRAFVFFAFLCLAGTSLGQVLDCTPFVWKGGSGIPAVSIANAIGVAAFPANGKMDVLRFSEGLGWAYDDTVTLEGGVEAECGSTVAVTDRNGPETIVVGCPGASTGAGEVRIYCRGESGWQLATSIVPPSGDVGGFGCGVDIAVGSPNSKSQLKTLAVTSCDEDRLTGSLYVYNNQTDGGCGQEDWGLSFTYSGERGDGMGPVMDVSNAATLVGVGRPGVGGGCVTVFGTNTSSSSWTLQEEQCASGVGSFGNSFGLYGSTEEAGNPKNYEVGLFAGDAMRNVTFNYQNTTFNDLGVTYNTTLPVDPLVGTRGLVAGVAVAADHGFPRGCAVPVAAAVAPPGSGAAGVVMSYMYQDKWRNPYLLTSVIDGADLPGVDGPTFGSTLAFSNGTALVGFNGGSVVWCTGIECNKGGM